MKKHNVHAIFLASFFLQKATTNNLFFIWTLNILHLLIFTIVFHGIKSFFQHCSFFKAVEK